MYLKQLKPLINQSTSNEVLHEHFMRSVLIGVFTLRTKCYEQQWHLLRVCHYWNQERTGEICRQEGGGGCSERGAVKKWGTFCKWSRIRKQRLSTSVMFDIMNSCVYKCIFYTLLRCMHGIKSCFHAQANSFFYKGCSLHMTNPWPVFASLWASRVFTHYTSACDSVCSAEYEKAPSIGVFKPVLRASFLWTPPTPTPSLPFCFLLSVERLSMMGSPKVPPSPRSPCGSGSVPALVIDPSGPSGTCNSELNRITAKKTAAWPPQTCREEREKEKEARLLLTISSSCQHLSRGSQVSKSSQLGRY